MKTWQATFILTFVSLYGGIGVWLLGSWLVEHLKALHPPRMGPNPWDQERLRPQRRRVLTKMITPLLLAVLLFSRPLLPEATEAMKTLRTAAGQTVLVPKEVPDKAGFQPLATMSVNGGLILLLYDDLTTDRPVDYVEAYNLGRTLLAIAWYDQFGILRTAVDANLKDPTASGPAGVFVMAVDPKSLL